MTLTVTHGFVSGVADDPTAAAAGEVLPSHWNANHSISGTVDSSVGARTILTADTNYYVRSDGSDSNTGTANNAAGAWLTLAHANTYIGQNIDFNSHTVYVNIGAGSFAGFSLNNSVGGGTWIWRGAGSGSTTITAGSNGDCITIGANDSYFTLNRVKIVVPAGGNGIVFLTNGVGEIFLGDDTTLPQQATDLVFDLTSANSSSRVINCVATGGIIQEVHNTATDSITFASGGGSTISYLLDIEEGAAYEANCQWTFTGTLTVTSAVAFVSTQSQVIIGLASFGHNSAPTLAGGATVTGQRFQVSDNSSINGTYSLTRNWFPGTSDGSCDATSAYDGFHGGILSETTTNILEQSNLGNPQAYRLYNTVDNISSPVNYEVGIFDWRFTSNVLTIGTNNNGSGAGRNLKFIVGGSNKLDFGISVPGNLGGPMWYMPTLAGGFGGGGLVFAPFTTGLTSAILDPITGNSSIVFAVDPSALGGLSTVGYNANAIAPAFAGFKTRATNSLDSTTALVSGDGIVSMTAWGASGSSNNYINSGQIVLEADGTFTTTSAPTRFNVYVAPSGSKVFLSRFQVTNHGSILTSPQGAIATNATDGFLYIPTCAGQPTGTPTTQTGMVAIVWDTTNHKFWVYDGAWKGGTNPGVWT